MDGDNLIVTETVDFEVDPQEYTITIRAFDGEFAITQDVTIFVGDMNETPPNTMSIEGQIDSIDVDLSDLGFFRPIDDALNGIETNRLDDGFSSSILRFAGFNGQENLGSLFYSSDIDQIIRSNVIDPLSALRIQNEMPEDAYENAETNAEIEEDQEESSEGIVGSCLLYTSDAADE